MTDFPTGFPARPAQAVLSGLMTELRARADTARTEAVTGRMADIAEGRGGRIAEVLDVETRLADLATRQDSIALAQGRSATAQASLAGLVDLTGDLLSQAGIALQTGSRGALETLSQTARDALGGAIGMLNATFAGRSLFAGDASDGAAVAGTGEQLAAAAAAIAGAPDAAAADTALTALFAGPPIYRGGTGDAPEVEIAANERVAYTARADTPEILSALRGLATVALAFDPAMSSTLSEPERRALAEIAIADLRDVLAPLNALRGQIGSAEARIETVRMRNIAEQTRLTDSVNALTGRDPLEAAVRMQEVDGQLETLFLTTARFSQLSLASFLR